MGLALSSLGLFSMEVCCLYSGMGRCLTSFIQIRFLYLLPEWSWLKSWNLFGATCLFWVKTQWDHHSDWKFDWTWVLMAAPLKPSRRVLRIDWWDVMVELLQKFLLSFDLCPLETVFRNVRWALMMLAETRASSWEIAEVDYNRLQKIAEC